MLEAQSFNDGCIETWGVGHHCPAVEVVRDACEACSLNGHLPTINVCPREECDHPERGRGCAACGLRPRRASRK
jgi:hypothetical protein